MLQIKAQYYQSFVDMVDFSSMDGQDPEVLKQFTKQVRKNHSSFFPTVGSYFIPLR